MARSHRCVAVATGGRRGRSGRRKKISGDVLVSRRTIPICAKVREPQRRPDDHPTMLRRLSKTLARIASDTSTTCSRCTRRMRRSTFVAPDRPGRRCSRPRRERVGHRVAKAWRHRARRLAAATLTGPSLPATRLACRKNKTGRTRRPVGSTAIPATRECGRSISGLLLPAARRSRPAPAAR